MEDQRIIGGEYRIESGALRCEIRNKCNADFSIGRTCLYSIIDALKSIVGEVLLPDYMCSSIVEVLIRIDIPIKHYHINTSFNPEIDDIKRVAKDCNERFAILLISYFGMVNLDDTISAIRVEFPEAILIIDDVQNYYGFGKHKDYDYCFTSYRKWFATPDGADVIIKENMPSVHSYPLQADYVMYKVAGNILKNYREMIGDLVSLELIEKGEKMMDEEYRFGCSELSKRLFCRIDTESIAKKRKQNAKYLHNGLKRLGILHLYNPTQVPLFVPIVVKERDVLRKKLFADNIFTPVHWLLEDTNKQGDNELYRTELSLICDQRYDLDDMERVLRGIENAM